MDRDPLSLKNLAFYYLCFFAVAYPLLAFFLMDHSDGFSGTRSVQIFQLLAVCAFAYFWRFRKKTKSVLAYFDLWTVGVFYFFIVSLYFSLFNTKDEKSAEFVFAARFWVWFICAATFARVPLPYERYERLAQAFWLGSVVQCVVALYCRLAGIGSTYKEVFATTGSSQVSGKTIVSFVVLGTFLSIYWILTKKKRRFLYATTAFAGLLVLAQSYNRSAQLGLGVALCYAWYWCARRKNFKIAFALSIGLAFSAVFLASEVGGRYLTRWNNVAADRGSGRTVLIRAAVDNFVSPRTAEAFWVGSGYCRMKKIMYASCGNAIVVHNDFFDFLTAYGFVGGVYYLLIASKLFFFANKISSFSLEFLFCKITTIFTLATGLCTGLFQSTYVFFMLIATIYYLRAQEERRILEKFDNYNEYSNFNDNDNDGSEEDDADDKIISERADNLDSDVEVNDGDKRVAANVVISVESSFDGKYKFNEKCDEETKGGSKTEREENANNNDDKTDAPKYVEYEFVEFD